MAAVFDLAKTRIGNKRDQVEDALRDRVDKFETKVGEEARLRRRRRRKGASAEQVSEEEWKYKRV